MLCHRLAKSLQLSDLPPAAEAFRCNLCFPLAKLLASFLASKRAFLLARRSPVFRRASRQMPRKAAQLGPLDIKRASHSGTRDRNEWIAVGGVSGLLLQIAPSGSKSWLLRTMVGGKRRAVGLGGYPEVSLAAAREVARETKQRISSGVDPIEERKAARSALAAAQRRGLTFTQAVERCLKAKLAEFRNEKHQKQWQSTLETYAIPVIGDQLVDDIEVQDILRVLEPIWSGKTETASRLRGRIESVLAWATVAGHRTRDNPARWKGNLDALLAKPTKVATVEKWPALSQEDATRWWSDLIEREGMGARALQFQTLTASRSGAVRHATWDEIDFDQRLWTIQPGRKSSKVPVRSSPHRVPLTDEMIALLNALPREPDQQLIFWAPRGGALSDMSLSAVMRRIHDAAIRSDRNGYFDKHSKKPAVPHGLRSTFRDWTAENGYDRDLAEIALAHSVGSTVERAYRRTDMLERRRAMMADWASFLIGRGEQRGKSTGLHVL